MLLIGPQLARMWWGTLLACRLLKAWQHPAERQWQGKGGGNGNGEQEMKQGREWERWTGLYSLTEITSRMVVKALQPSPLQSCHPVTANDLKVLTSVEPHRADSGMNSIAGKECLTLLLLCYWMQPPFPWALTSFLMLIYKELCIV